MKIAALIARYLLGLIFFVFGLNGFLNFIPMGAMPSGLAGQFLSVLVQSHYVHFVSAIQLAGGALLLINRYVPLALTLLGPVIVNILSFHMFLDSENMALAIVVAVLWFLVFLQGRSSFSGLFCGR